MDRQIIALLVIADVLMIVILISFSTGAYQKLKVKLNYDKLTRLPVKDKFFEMFRKTCENGQETYTIGVMDISGFKMINEMYGYEEGDKLLRYSADVLKKCLNSYLIGRLNSDVFVFAFVEKDEATVDTLVHTILENLSMYRGNIRPYAYFGICKGEDDVCILVDHAELALETIKRSRVTSYTRYSDDTRREILKEKKMEIEMMSALEQGQFVVFYQPKYDIATGKAVGAEALVRWIHPVDGLIGPNDFIPLFEKDGLVIRLDEYVWECTCKQIRQWLDCGYDVVPVSVNVSRVQIFNQHLKEKIFELTDKYQIPHHLLELEITESAFLDDTRSLYSAMEYFRENGFMVSMDDFGSGYSTLNMLKDGNVDIVKIDKEFLNETVATNKGKLVIRSAVEMVKNLDMDVIAEGVETEDQANYLLSIGCNKAQGYYYSKPVDSIEFEKKVYVKGAC